MLCVYINVMTKNRFGGSQDQEWTLQRATKFQTEENQLASGVEATKRATKLRQKITTGTREWKRRSNTEGHYDLIQGILLLRPAGIFFQTLTP